MEELKKAALAIAADLGPENSRRVLVTSAVPGEGVTTVTVALARYLYTLRDLRALVVELNFARPSLTTRFALDRERSLEAFAAGRLTLAQSVQEIHPGVVVLALAGNGTDDELTGGLQPLLDRLFDAAAEFDLVLFDTPAVAGNATALAVAHRLPRGILVVAAGRTRRQVIERARRELTTGGVELIGAVLNFHQRFVPDWFYRWLIQ